MFTHDQLSVRLASVAEEELVEVANLIEEEMGS